MTLIVINIVTQLLIYILVTCIAKPLLQIALNSIPSWISAAFFIESQFEDIQGFSLSGICNALFTFALAYLVLFFIVKLIQVYFSWTNGDPETSPMTVLLGFMKALIVMIAFGTLYEYFVQIIYSMYTMVLQNGFGGVPSADSISFNAAFTLIGGIITMVIAVITFVIYIGVLARGIQILLLRLGIVFAAIGLLNADGGAFKGYIKKFISNAFSILIQIFLICLTVRLLASNHYILALLTASTALKGADMLSEFLQKTGFIGEQGLTSAIGQASHAMHGISSANRALSKPAGLATSLGASAAGKTTSLIGKGVSAGGKAVLGKSYKSGSESGKSLGRGLYKIGSGFGKVGSGLSNAGKIGRENSLNNMFGSNLGSTTDKMSAGNKPTPSSNKNKKT